MRRFRMPLLAGLLSAAAVLLAVRLIGPRVEQTESCAACRRAEVPVPPAAPEEGHVRLRPPAPGEWRAHVDEPAQSFEDYVASGPNRKCAHRSTLYIQPLATPIGRRSMMAGADERHERAIELMREYAEVYFNVQAKVLPPIPMFEETLDAARGQCDASAVADLLAARLPADALVLIGITMDDLYSGKLNYVFGVGSLSRRTGVYSLRRYQTKDEILFRARALKLLSHEAGHILSIPHCVTWSCVMQGANSLPEHDAHPMHPCPVDLRKLEWNAGFDRNGRYRKLADFYRRIGLTEDAIWIERRLPR